RTITSNRSASRSTILPFPSSPHWAPMTAITIEAEVREVRERNPISDLKFQISDSRNGHKTSAAEYEEISAAPVVQLRTNDSRDQAAVAAPMCLSIMREIAASDVAPTTRSSSRPFLKRISVGMPLIPNRCDTDGLSSTFNLTTRALPAYFSATASTVGASIRHGAHQAAQKSTSTG